MQLFVCAWSLFFLFKGWDIMLLVSTVDSILVEIVLCLLLKKDINKETNNKETNKET